MNAQTLFNQVTAFSRLPENAQRKLIDRGNAMLAAYGWKDHKAYTTAESKLLDYLIACVDLGALVNEEATEMYAAIYMAGREAK